MQRNWIGRSEGARVTFTVQGSGNELPVFTTRPDTLFGATFFALGLEHLPIGELIAGTEHERAVVADYVRHTAGRLTVERETKEKDGVFTGRYAVNPVNGEAIPIWVADYVLMEATARSWPWPRTTSGTMLSRRSTTSRSAGRCACGRVRSRRGGRGRRAHR